MKDLEVFRTMRGVIIKHWPAIVVAAVVGLYCIVPPLFFALSPGYAGVALVGQKDEEHYIARTEQAYAGHPTLGNTFLSRKDQPYFQAGLGETIVAGMGKVSGMSVPQVTVAAKFLFPFCAALLLYALVYALFGSIWIALLSALWLFFGDNLSSGISPWVQLLHGTSPNGYFLPFMRPINPEISSLFLFGALYVLYRGFFERATPRVREIIVSGLLIGTSVYLNPYHFTFLVVFCALWFLWRLYQKDHQSVVPMFYVGGVAFLCALPFLLNYWSLIGQPDYAETAARFGLIVSYAPVIGIWSALLILCPLFLWPEKYARAKPFFLISGIAVIILINQQVITGHLMQQNHYHFYVTKPLADIMLGMYTVVVASLLVRRENLRIALCAIVACVLLYNGLLMQRDSYVATYPSAVASQKYSATLAHLEALPEEETIWADRTLSLYIPMYSKHNVPNNFYAGGYLVSNEYLEKRLLLEYKLRGVAPPEIYEAMQKDRADVSVRIFGLYWREKDGSYAAIPDSLLEGYAKDYETFFAKPYPELFQDMGITMVAWDKTAEPTWDIEGMSFAEKIFESGDITVYRLQ